MFDGAPLPQPPWDILLPLLCAASFAAVALALLRMVQTQEWNLTWQSLTEPRTMWFGRHVEGGRTVGVAFSHVIGLAGWAIVGMAIKWTAVDGLWMPKIPFSTDPEFTGNWSAGMIGVAIGAASLPLRWGSRKLAGWLAEIPETAWQHGETDRYMRSALTAILVSEVLILAVSCQLEQEAVGFMPVIVLSYIVFIVWRSLRLLQLLLINNLSIGWGIAYLCSLELIPTWALISVLHLG